MRLCFHDWSSWSKPIDTAHDYKKVQYRCCISCNKVQVKKIKQPFNLWFSAKSIETKLKEKNT